MAGQLRLGEHILKADGTYSVVDAISFVIEPQLMYNLTVDQAHTFFVGQGWLVHNERCFPLGFANEQAFQLFGDKLKNGLQQAGYNDVTPLFQGSSVTGVSHDKEEAFDVGRVSDFDIALASSNLIELAKSKGIKIRDGGTGFRTGQIQDDELKILGLFDLQRQLSDDAGRPVNFMIYRTTGDAFADKPSLLVP